MKKEYLTYSAEDLAQEANFIQWIRYPESGHESWKNWLSAHPEQADKVADATAIVNAIKWEVPVLDADRKTEIWAAIDQATPATEAKTIQIQTSKPWIRWAAAAVAILIVAGSWWWTAGNNQSTNATTSYAQIISHPLPDGSVVSINAMSQVAYQAKKWDKKREVELEGEAFFEVEKGSSFIVKTALGTVEVLGTSFNVEARDDIFRVICYTGKVRVTLPNGPTAVITPQQGVEAVNGQLQSRAITHQNDIAWQEQLHHFDKIRLAEVFAELERQYEVQVNCPPHIAERRYTGSFKNNELEKALESVCWPMNLHFESKGGVVFIKESQ